MTRTIDLVALVLLAVITTGTGHLILKTALTAPTTAAQVEAWKGM